MVGISVGIFSIEGIFATLNFSVQHSSGVFFRLSRLTSVSVWQVNRFSSLLHYKNKQSLNICDNDVISMITKNLKFNSIDMIQFNILHLNSVEYKLCCNHSRKSRNKRRISSSTK